ncbi:MAG: ASPIC/UnbV domain-containing protein, partial [Vicinamibacteria bacterium]
ALVKTGSSYASQSELVLTFGLGAAAKASKVEVIWPGGATETVTDVAAGKTVTIAQGKGLVAGRP